jgi:hypothetical protein
MNPQPDPDWISGELSVGNLIACGVRHIWVNQDNQVLAFIRNKSVFFHQCADERLGSIEEVGMLGQDVLETGMKVINEQS